MGELLALSWKNAKSLAFRVRPSSAQPHSSHMTLDSLLTVSVLRDTEGTTGPLE